MIHNKIYMSLKNMHFFLNPLIIVHLKKIFLLDQWIAQTVMFMIGRLFATYAMNLGFQFTVEVINENDHNHYENNKPPAGFADRWLD